MNKDKVIEQFKTMSEEQQKNLIKALGRLKETVFLNKEKRGQGNSRKNDQHKSVV